MATKYLALLVLATVLFSAAVVFGQEIGARCGDNGPFCPPQLACKNETCACAYTWQIYDSQLRQCVSPVGGFCKGDGSLRCTPNSECSSKETAFKDYLGFCFCSAPYETLAGPSCSGSVESGKPGLNNPADPPPLLCCPTTSTQNKL